MSAHKRKASDQEQSPESLEPSTSKRKYLTSTCSDDDEDRKVETKNGLRSPSFSSHNKPAELFRKDLISAMKLADSESLQLDEYFFISDPWKQEWERGVQVPVNLTSIPELVTRIIRPKAKSGDFKIPRKQLHACQDETYKQGNHELTGMQQLSEQVVRYDLDDRDVCWIQRFNEEQEKIAEPYIHEWTMERVIEELENNCHENMKKTIKTEEGLGIEYDEDVICDVCRSPDGEDSNEMVFCDGCDICIHQACYGIQTIPEGTWLCRTCALGIKPQCILCPRTGGAMKSTRSGTKWAHVSCALWIPEVSIGCVEKMEPITKISQIPASRWGLLCCLCKERLGACIQCSVKTCKIAFHVTCAFKNGLDMRTILDETDKEDGVKLKAYCPKHSRKRDRCHSDSDPDSPRKETSPRKDVTPRKELTIEERENLRIKKLKRLEEEFYRVVDRKVVANKQQVDRDIVEAIYVYWKMKRKSNFNQPLLTPKTEEEDLLEKQQEDSLLARMRMFVRLRQDLERVRNLSYMVSKREKTKRQYRKVKENVFYAQLAVLTDTNLALSSREVKKVINLCHDKSIYDNEHVVPPSFSSEYLSIATTDFKQEAASTASEMSPISLTDYDSIHSLSTRRRGRIKQRPNKTTLVISDAEESGPDFGSVSSTDSIRPRRLRNDTVHADSISTSLRSRHNSGHSDLDLKRKPLRPQVTASERSAFDEVRTDKSVHTPPKHDITRNVFSTLASLVNSPPETQSDDHTTPVLEHGRTRSASLKSPSKHSQEFKEELDGLLQKSKLIVADTVREKVQAKLLKSSRLKSPYLNGFHDKSQQKMEHFFRNGSQNKYNKVNLFARNETGSASKHECTNVITTRILNELSPTRDRLENAWFGSNNSPRSSLRGYKIPKISSTEKSNASSENAHTPETRSVRRRIETDIESSMKERIFENVDREISISRSTTPESTTSSYDSYRSNGDSDSRLFRSSVEQNDAFVDVENVYEEENLKSLTGRQRVTRSHENMKITRNLKRSKLGDRVTKAQIL